MPGPQGLLLRPVPVVTALIAAGQFAGFADPESEARALNLAPRARDIAASYTTTGNRVTQARARAPSQSTDTARKRQHDRIRLSEQRPQCRRIAAPIPPISRRTGLRIPRTCR